MDEPKKYCSVQKMSKIEFVPLTFSQQQQKRLPLASIVCFVWHLFVKWNVFCWNAFSCSKFQECVFLPCLNYFLEKRICAWKYSRRSCLVQLEIRILSVHWFDWKKKKIQANIRLHFALIAQTKLVESNSNYSHSTAIVSWK